VDLARPPVDFEASRPAQRYRELVGEGGVHYQACVDCRRPLFPPRVLCPACGSTRLEWRESAGTGTVYSATTVHARDAEPYTIALVDLDEGIRVMVTIADATPDDPPIDARVTVTVGEVDGELALMASPWGE
jgi:uncharacterized protein